MSSLRRKRNSEVSRVDILINALKWYADELSGIVARDALIEYEKAEKEYHSVEEMERDFLPGALEQRRKDEAVGRRVREHADHPRFGHQLTDDEASQVIEESQ